MNRFTNIGNTIKNNSILLNIFSSYIHIISSFFVNRRIMSTIVNFAAYVFEVAFLPSLFIRNRIPKHIIEDGLSKFIELLQLLLLHSNHFVQAIQLRHNPLLVFFWRDR